MFSIVCLWNVHVIFLIFNLFYILAGKFHKLLFLAPGGKTVFQGTVAEAENYFKNLGYQKPDKVNPADFYMDVIGGMCERTHSSSNLTLPECWVQHASQNSTDAAAVQNSSQANVMEELSFSRSAEMLIKENQGIMHLMLNFRAVLAGRKDEIRPPVIRTKMDI